jgi:predicted LPLAT superfamily acyltransferase
MSTGHGKSASGWQMCREGGTRPVLALFAALLRLPGGRLWGELLLGPITLYFFLRRPAARRASRAYLGAVRGRPARAWHVFRHFYSFAQTLLDRFFLLERGEKALRVSVEGGEALAAALEKGRGAILLSAHLGNFDILRLVLGAAAPVPVRVVMHRLRQGPLTALLAASEAARSHEIIELDGDIGPPLNALLALRETLAANGVVGLLGDRAVSGQRSAPLSFLGRPAHFPLGPYVLADRLEAPLFLAFAIRSGWRRYEIRLSPLPAPREDVKNYLDSLRIYVSALETLCRRHPYDWFNFYDFWSDAEAGREAPAPRPSPAFSPLRPAPLGPLPLSWRRRALRLLAAALTLPLLAATPDPPFTIDTLFRRLGTPAERRARFVETRTIKGLSAPLILTGTLTYRRPDHLEKTVETPRPERLTAEGNRLTLEAAGKPPQSIDADASPPLAAMIEAIRATFAGDLAALRRHFSVGLEGNWNGWTLTLVPLDPLLARFLVSATLSGREGDLTALTYREANGDQSVLSLTPLS